MNRDRANFDEDWAEAHRLALHDTGREMHLGNQDKFMDKAIKQRHKRELAACENLNGAGI